MASINQSSEHATAEHREGAAKVPWGFWKAGAWRTGQAQQQEEEKRKGSDRVSAVGLVM